MFELNVIPWQYKYEDPSIAATAMNNLLRTFNANGLIAAQLTTQESGTDILFVFQLARAPVGTYYQEVTVTPWARDYLEAIQMSALQPTSRPYTKFVSTLITQPGNRKAVIVQLYTGKEANENVAGPSRETEKKQNPNTPTQSDTGSERREQSEDRRTSGDGPEVNTAVLPKGVRSKTRKHLGDDKRRSNKRRKVPSVEGPGDIQQGSQGKPKDIPASSPGQPIQTPSEEDNNS